jgi:hypothetical protein|uniref:SAM superfamily protein n=1 Tax=Myoviridae sp. ctByu2 TaxID=2827668 RepID=A0A8S5SAP4_9CAUD|nr:MAG TPA: SAM superfamily protein [Myoviridae sp. ctByu2]
MAKQGCDKDCSTCGINNWTYCAVQFGLKNQELLLQQQEMISSLITILSPLFSQATAPIAPSIPGEEDVKEKVPEKETKK